MIYLMAWVTALASAIVPLINIEAYLAMAATDLSSGGVVLAALLASTGQMIGKCAWYAGGANSAKIPWLATRLAQPKYAAAVAKWQRRAQGRPFYTAGLLLVSAMISVPPFAVMSAVAGVMRVHLGVFIVTGFVGRFVRFLSLLGAVSFAFPW